jgi:hypothetical protein
MRTYVLTFILFLRCTNLRSLSAVSLPRVEAAELLIWTGTGEPPISPATLAQLQASFAGSKEGNAEGSKGGYEGRVSYDVAVCPSSFFAMSGDRKIEIFRTYRRILTVLATRPTAPVARRATRLAALGGLLTMAVIFFSN